MHRWREIRAPKCKVRVHLARMSTREAQFQQLISEFPDSPMGHFSLGRLYVDEKRFAEAVVPLTQATVLDPEYAAAWVALGDAQAGLSNKDAAKSAFERALATKHGRRDMSLQADLDARLRELEDF